MVFARRAGVPLRPAQLVIAAFALLIAAGTLLLKLPVAVDEGAALGWTDSLFWSASASTVTGLGTTDVAVFSVFGEVVLLLLIQVGGFGIMTIGSALALVIARRVGLRQRMAAQAEIGRVQIGELGALVRAIAVITLVVEAVTALVLFVPMLRSDDTGVPEAAWQAVFHGVSAFNNAGISLYSDSMSRFAGDAVVVLAVSAAFIVGGLGFPILVAVVRRSRPHRWSLHARITLVATAALLVVGPLIVLTFEWDNPSTLGPMGVADKVLAAWFQGATPRTAGFNTIDIGALDETTQLVITALMFIGAGPASTSGGIKVTTFAVLVFAMWSEVRGDTEINVFGRRIPMDIARQAMTVAFLSVLLVFGTGLALTAMSPFDFTATLFEATSAFGTVGLSTGITSALSNGAQLLLVAIMFAGRVGPVTFVTALALRQSARAYRFAEERPIIG